MNDKLLLGAYPANEEVHHDKLDLIARIWMRQLVRVFGDLPFFVMPLTNEVALLFDLKDVYSREQAFHIEDRLPVTWDWLAKIDLTMERLWPT